MYRTLNSRCSGWHCWFLRGCFAASLPMLADVGCHLAPVGRRSFQLLCGIRSAVLWRKTAGGRRTSPASRGPAWSCVRSMIASSPSRRLRVDWCQWRETRCLRLAASWCFCGAWWDVALRSRANLATCSLRRGTDTSRAGIRRSLRGRASPCRRVRRHSHYLNAYMEILRSRRPFPLLNFEYCRGILYRSDSKLTLSGSWSRRGGPFGIGGWAVVRNQSKRDIQRVMQGRAHHPRWRSLRTSMSRLSLFSWWEFCDLTLSQTTQSNAILRKTDAVFHKNSFLVFGYLVTCKCNYSFCFRMHCTVMCLIRLCFLGISESRFVTFSSSVFRLFTLEFPKSANFTTCSMFSRATNYLTT